MASHPAGEHRNRLPTFLSQPQIMLPMERPIPRYCSIMLDSSLEAADTEIRSPFRRWYSLHEEKGGLRGSRQAFGFPA